MGLSAQQSELLKARLRERGLFEPLAGRIVPRGVGAIAPATPLQASLWMLEQLDHLPGAYNVPSVARLSGPLDVRALEHALGEIVRRHEVLRTRFRPSEDRLEQVVATATSFHLDSVDLRALRSDLQAGARQLLEQEAARPARLDADGPFRALLVRLGDNDHVLALNIHHIVTDGYSMGVLSRELTALYGAFSAGRPSPLLDLPIQFGDYAVWSHGWMAGAELERQSRFWRDELHSPLPVLALPADRHRPARPSGRGLHEPVRLPRDLTTRLRSFSRAHGTTLFEILLAAFTATLNSYSGQEDIIVGSPVANRSRAELTNLIGYFVNVLPFRVSLAADPTFHEIVHRVRDVAHRVHAHQELPFAKVVEIVQPPREPARNPIYQVELTLMDSRTVPPVFGYGLGFVGDQRLRLGDVAMMPFPLESGVSKFDLTILLWNCPEDVEGTIEYSTDLFDALTIRALAKRFVTLLDRGLQGSQRRLSELRGELGLPAVKKVSTVKRRVVRPQ